MNEMTQYQNQAPAQYQQPGQYAPAQIGGNYQAAEQSSETVMSITDWANELHAAGSIANILANTEFVPQGIRGNVEAVGAAILTGYEIGLKPMNALANIFVVRGRPAMYARTMVSLVLSHGHEIERTDATEQAVTVRGRRKGSQSWQTFTWDMNRAKRAGYTSNQKYTTDPQAMLTAKAQAECCRTMFPDVLSGMAASAEEVELGDFDEPAQVEAKAKEAPKSTARKVQRKPAAKAPEPAAPAATRQAPQDEPEQAQEEPQEPTQAPDTDQVDQDTGEVQEEAYISRVDQGKISNLLNDLGVTDRSEKLAFVREATGIDDLAGVNGLTVTQGQELIANLEKELADYPAADTE